VVQVLDKRDFILAEGEADQALVSVEAFNLLDFVVVEAEVFHVWVKAHVFNHCDIVVGVVDDLKVSGRGEVKHLFYAVVACVQLNQMLDVSQVLQRRQ